MPGLHFSSYGHVKPPLLHALSMKRKKTNVAAAAAAAVLKAFTHPRGKHVLVRQGVKYRNMFHAGGGLVRERRPGEEVTPEKAGWVTDEESEQSETESSDEAAPVAEEASLLEEATEEAEEMMDETGSSIMEVEDEKESTLDLIPEDEVTKNDLLKLELSLMEKDLPKVSPVSETIVAKMEEKIVEVPVIPVEEPASEALPTQEEPVEVITCPEQNVSDVLVPERQPEQLLEPSGPETLSLSAVMNILQPPSQTTPFSLSEMILEPPSQSAPVTLSAVMNVFERPSESEPVISAVMNVLERPSELESVTSPTTMFVLESSEPVPTAIPITTEVTEPLESDLAPATVSDNPAITQLDIPVEVEEMQEEVVGGIQETQVAHADIEEIAIIPSQEPLEPTPEPTPEGNVVEMELTPITTELPVVAMSEPTTVATPEPVVTLPAAISEPTPEPVAIIPVAPDPSVALEPTVGPELLDPPVGEPIVTTPELTDTPSMLQPILLQQIPEPTVEVKVQREELEGVVVEDVGGDVVLISVQVVSPPQEAPVLAISEKHSEQLLDDEVCDYTETELNEDEEESEVEVNEQEELEGRLESTPSHMFKLTLPLPISTKTSTSSTVALCVKPEQTLSDLQKLIQHELSHSSSESHISFTTIATDPPPDYNGNTPPTNTPTGFAIKDSEHSVLRKSSCLDQSKYHNKPTSIPTRWSLSTEIGAFIGDASKAQSFAIEISPAPDKPPLTTIRVSLPTFDNRVSHMRSQLRLLGPNLSSLSALKSECDLLAHRSAQKHSILKLSISGLACLFLPLIVIAFTYLSQPGLLPSFRNPPPWDSNLSHPVTTYLAAGFIDILLLAGFAYLWSAYRSNGNQSLPDPATTKRVYSERGFDIKKWEELRAENKRLRDEIRRVAAEYDVTWDDDEVGETKETGTAATAA